MKYFLRILGALLTALLLGFLLFLIITPDNGGNIFAFFFIIGFVAFSIILWLAQTTKKVFGRFSLIFGIEWVTLPLSAAVHTESAAGLGGAIGAGLILAISVPVGLILGVIFLVLAYFNLRSY